MIVKKKIAYAIYVDDVNGAYIISTRGCIRLYLCYCVYLYLIILRFYELVYWKIRENQNLVLKKNAQCFASSLLFPVQIISVYLKLHKQYEKEECAD